MVRKLLGQGAFVAMALSGAAPAAAALSPLYQSLREIETILHDQHLADAFADQQAVVSVELTDPDTYTLRTETCTVVVKVVTVPADPGKPMMVGPRQFTLDFGQAACK